MAVSARLQLWAGDTDLNPIGDTFRSSNALFSRETAAVVARRITDAPFVAVGRDGELPSAWIRFQGQELFPEGGGQPSVGAARPGLRLLPGGAAARIGAALKPAVGPAPTWAVAMNDGVASLVLDVWRKAFHDAALLPVIGYPSKNQGVMTLTHTMGSPPMTIDGLVSRSPLANNALYSCEVSGGTWLNLYEIMLPDVPGLHGEPSSCQRYMNAAMKLGISVSASHYHWTGALMDGRFPLALHSEAAGMDPFEFSKRTIAALHAAMNKPVLV
jgi:hypothetical protein